MYRRVIQCLRKYKNQCNLKRAEDETQPNTRLRKVRNLREILSYDGKTTRKSRGFKPNNEKSQFSLSLQLQKHFRYLRAFQTLHYTTKTHALFVYLKTKLLTELKCTTDLKCSLLSIILMKIVNALISHSNLSKKVAIKK